MIGLKFNTYTEKNENWFESNIQFIVAGKAVIL